MQWRKKVPNTNQTVPAEAGGDQAAGASIASTTLATVGAALLAATACCGPFVIGMMVQAAVTLGGIGLIGLLNRWEAPVTMLVAALAAFTVWRVPDLLVRGFYTALAGFAGISAALRLVWDFGLGTSFSPELLLLVFANRQSALLILAILALIAHTQWLIRMRLLRQSCPATGSPTELSESSRQA
jgi:hypothetical protein